MKKILFILSLALIIPFTGISQKYAGVQSLYADVNTNDEPGIDRASIWLTWTPAPDYYGVRFGDLYEEGPFIRFAAEDLEEYVGQYLTQIRYNPRTFDSDPTTFILNPRIQVWFGGSIEENEDGEDEEEFIYDMGTKHYEYTDNFFKFNERNVVKIPRLQIQSGTEIWFGIVYTHSSGFPMCAFNYESPTLIANNYVPFKSDLLFIGQGYDEIYSRSEVEGDSMGWNQAIRIETLNCGEVTDFAVEYLEGETCKAVLSWNPPSDNEDAVYNIYRDANTLLQGKFTGTSYTDESFDIKKAHTWFVRAICDEDLEDDESDYTPQSLTACAPCGIPTSLNVNFEHTCDQAILSWKADPDAVKYEVWRETTKLDETEELTYTDTEGPFAANTKWSVKSICKYNVISAAQEKTPSTCVGIRDNEITFSIHPNPATTEITIKAGNIFNTVEIVNFLGQTVISQNNSTDNLKIDVSNLNGGVYFVRIASENGVSVQKFVKK